MEEKGKEWYLHHQLQKVDEGIVLPPPLDIVKENMDCEAGPVSNDPLRLFYRGVLLPEPAENRVQD